MPTTRMRTRAMTPIVQAAGSSLVPPGGTGEASRPPPKFSRAGARDFRTPTTMAVASLRPEPSGRHSRLDGALAFQSPPRSPPLCSVASQTASPRWAGSTVGETCRGHGEIQGLHFLHLVCLWYDHPTSSSFFSMNRCITIFLNF